MKGVSHELTRDGVPRKVTLVQGGGLPFSVQFKDGESIGVPVFGDEWVMKLRVYMVDANGWTTLTEPAYYDLYTANGDRYRFNACKTSPTYTQLVNLRTTAGREETYGDMGIEVVRDAFGTLRQVLLPSRLADIVVADSEHYAIKFYTPSCLEGGKDTNGCYRLNAGTDPFEIWTFANPQPGTLRKLLVSRIMGARTNVYDYTYNSEAETWTLATGDGVQVARQELQQTMWNDNRTERLVTRSQMAPDGTLMGRVIERIKTYSWGDGVTVRVTDPDGVNQTNTFSYNTAGYTETAVEPDGSWSWKGYDSAGRMTTNLTAVKDSALTSFKDSAHAVISDYTPVDPLDSPRLNDQQPRKVTESVLGTVVAKTYRAYRKDGNGALTEIVERCTDPSSAYGHAGNLRTVSTFYGTNAINRQIGRVATVVHPDGRMDTYTYDVGNYQPAVGEIPPSFQQDESGSYWCETVVHGTTNYPEGIAGKTTKECRILNSKSEPVLDESWICAGGPNYERVSWINRTFDDWQHPILSRASNGQTEETSWGANCCGKEWEIGADGVMTKYGYDSFGRMIHVIKAGATTNDPDITTSYKYDSEGRRITTTVSGGDLAMMVSSNQYDTAGRLVAAVDEQGILTTYNSEGLTSTVVRGGLTNTTVRYLDGLIKLTMENGQVKAWYDHGVNSDGTQWSKVFTGPAGTNSPMWSKTTTDLLGRTIKNEKPGFGDAVLSTIYSFNSMGQLASTTQQPSNLTTLYSYDDLGNQTRSGLNVNTNGVLDLAGPDRVNESATWFDQDNFGNYWQYRASILYADNNATPTTNSIQRTRLSGFSQNSNLMSEMVSTDINGNFTTSHTYVDRNNKTVTQTVNYPDSTNAAVQTTINGQLTTAQSKTGVQTDYTYDALGRQTSSSSPSPFRGEAGGEGARLVGTYTAYNSLGQVTSTTDAASNTTTYAYDNLGRRIQVTDALTNTTHTAYDAEGRVLATWGATYPVAYDYDAYGRMTAMYTYRGTNSLSSYSEISNRKSQMDRTRWVYDEVTGLLTNKLYADNHGPSYTYTPDGKLLTRTWARGVVTTYNYDSLSQLTNISYSDNTPGVTFAFDRLGRQTTITDGTGTRLFSYTDAFQLASETNAAAELVRIYDPQGRPVGYDLVMAGSTSAVSSIRYDHDSFGRFSALSNTVGGALRAAKYSYFPGSDLLAGYDLFSGGTAASLSVRRSFEPNRNLITQILNTSGTNLISRFDYVNDSVGRRTQRVDSSSLTNDFVYNTRSELIEALMGTNNFAYRYDPIGNRTVATNNEAITEYLANSLNQYSQITNNQPPITILPAYDLDGNLVTNGVWAFAWDAENRLVSASSNGQWVASFTYDYMSRRVSKMTAGATNTFIYDGWSLISEVNSTVTNHYVWGLDLSGTLQGAGGIGGLLATTIQQPGNSSTVFSLCDANGNITDYVAGDDSIAAHYEYDPYGNITAKSGVLADLLAFRFSSKYTDSETGLLYYGFRYYMPEMGRWANRDPLEELGGINVYVFLANSPTSFIDLLGAKKVPYLWVSLVEREFGFLDIWDFIKLKWKWMEKLKDLLLFGDDVLDFFTNSTTLWVKTSETDVPDCYVVIDDKAKDKIDITLVYTGPSSGFGGIISIYIDYLHTLEWEWGPDPSDPCCK
jgi:RHS repeat-associated protein